MALPSDAPFSNALSVDALPAEAQARIRPYVSNLDRHVFAITGLPEEVIAVLLAYYSRSRDDLRTNLARLIADDTLDIESQAATAQSAGPSRAQDKARSFHEKWVVGYGHASVAEHAVIHLAMEQVSIIASKVIEDLRLGSYTEKSTRYVVFDKGSFADLPGLAQGVRREYRRACEDLFSTYLDLFPRVEAKLEQVIPFEPGQPKKRRASALRAHTCDLLRGLLPASTKTNLGITTNARSLASLLSKMQSWPLREVREIAEQMQREAASVTPTLLRHAGLNPFRASLRDAVSDALPTDLQLALPSSLSQTPSPPVRLLRHDPDALQRIVLALSYDLAVEPDASARLASLEGLDEDRLAGVVRGAMSGRGPHDPAPRAFEASSVTLELDLDYGAYRDLQRHRMLTPSAQLLGCSLGANIPDDIDLVDARGEYQAALDRAAEVWLQLVEIDPFAAQYVVPLAFRVRTLWTLNLRQLFYVVELRSARQGHTSYRRVAQAIYHEACRVHPWLSDLIRVDLEEYRLARS